jgi:hypothetical protein
MLQCNLDLWKQQKKILGRIDGEIDKGILTTLSGLIKKKEKKEKEKKKRFKPTK